MTIHVNGEIFDIETNTALIDFLNSQAIGLKNIVIELNGTILTDFNQILKNGNKLEIIRMVGGG